MAQFSKYMKHIKYAWQLVGIVLFLFIFIEIGLALVFFIRDCSTQVQLPDRRAGADTYGNSKWQDQYYKEFKESRVSRWEPYVYWRRKPYNGDYINVNREGIRIVSSKEEITSERTNNRIKLFMFGGSTMWGTGARDKFTIPAMLEQSIETEMGIDVEMTNFGETGYVSTQEVILLIRQLQQGNIPDIVVFYDGVNDTYSAYQQNIAGLPQNEYNRIKEFQLLSNNDMSRVINNMLNKLLILRFSRKIYRKISPFYTSSYDKKVDIHTIAKEEVEIYQNNIKIVSGLADKYGFKYIFYWQPTIFQKKILTKYEQDELKLQENAITFFDIAYSYMRKNTDKIVRDYNFINLSDIFSTTREPMFVDFCHLGERGNNRIADRMMKDIYPLINPIIAQEQGK